MENRGYRHLELEQDDAPQSRRRWGTIAGLMTAAVVLLGLHACQQPARAAEGEAITLHFACKSKAVALNALKSANVTDFLADATAKGFCAVFDSRPAVLGHTVTAQKTTIGGRNYLMALSEVYIDRGAPWYAWSPVVPVGKEP